MCSGCSGDYTGGYDDEDQREPDTDTHGGHDDAHDSGFTGDWNTEGYPAFSTAMQPTPNGFRQSSTRADAYEVLVSTDRIVEIRIVREQSSRITATQRAHTPDLPSGGPSDRGCEALSAKDYRTRAHPASVSAVVSPARLIHLIILSLAIYTAGALGIWLALH
jgi:hypothetical protein